MSDSPDVTSEQFDSLLTVLDLIRFRHVRTRPEIVNASGLGRNLVSHRVQQLLQWGLVEETGLAPSTGGRAARELRFNSSAGSILVAELGASSIAAAFSDLSGALSDVRHESCDVTAGPELVLQRVEALFQELLSGPGRRGELWGIGLGLPGPVEFVTARPVAPPIMPGWDGFDVRGYLADRYSVPVWVDNDVNVMALGELRGGAADGLRDVIYVKVGTGIGAGLISGGRLHRGTDGCAGDIGHISADERADVICRCGAVGCLEALAGGAAIGRDGVAAARSGQSQLLGDLLASGRPITARDVADAAQRGDSVAAGLITQSARLVGESIARLVNFFNPSLILVGGGVAESGDAYLATVRQVVFQRSLPLATRSLQINRSPMHSQAGLRGAAFMVIGELFSRELLSRWAGRGRPTADLFHTASLM